MASASGNCCTSNFFRAGDWPKNARHISTRSRIVTSRLADYLNCERATPLERRSANNHDPPFYGYARISRLNAEQRRQRFHERSVSGAGAEVASFTINLLVWPARSRSGRTFLPAHCDCDTSKPLSPNPRAEQRKVYKKVSALSSCIASNALIRLRPNRPSALETRCIRLTRIRPQRSVFA